MADKKNAFQESLEAIKAKHRAKYDAEFGATVQPRGYPAWEVDETKGRYVDHVAKCIYSTPFQLITGMKEAKWAADFPATGLVLDEAVVTAMQTAANAQKELTKAQTKQRELLTTFKRVRHFGSTLCIVAKKTAESCLKESGKWPKNLQSLAEHCNNLVAVLQPLNQQQPEVAQLVNLHSLCCSLTEQIYGGDASWPTTAQLILTTIEEFQIVLRTIQEAEANAPPPAPASPDVITPVPVVDEAKKKTEKAQKAKNRALGYIFRFKKLLKKCLPMCLSSTPGWPEKVAELVGVLDEITERHTDPDPECNEQQWLDTLMQETRVFCDTALADEPSWVENCKALSASLEKVEALFPNPIPPAPVVPIAVPRVPVLQPAPVARPVAAVVPMQVMAPRRGMVAVPPRAGFLGVAAPMQPLRPMPVYAAPRVHPFPTAGFAPKRFRF